MRTLRFRTMTLIALFALAGALLIGAPFFGMTIITPPMLFAGSFDNEIFWQLRVPRVAVAFLAGSGLSLCGMVFQALFRNPLADPFTLGTASGASCGAALTILAGITGSFLSIPYISLGAFAGAVLAMSAVFLIASRRKNASGMTMLLAGIAVSFLFSSIMMCVQYFSSLRDSFQIVRWLMGGIQVAGFDAFWSIVPFWLCGVIIIGWHLPMLDQLLTGEDLAKSRGVDILRTRRFLLVATTLLIGSLVAVCGPIGFIGLIVPHVCRRIVGANHLFLGPACLATGGVVLVIADTIGRIVIAPAELPVGIIMALTGAPFFLMLLFGKKREFTIFD